MKLKIREAGEKTAFIKTAAGDTKTVEYKDKQELSGMKDNSDIETINTADGQKIKENTVKDSLGEELAIGDVLEVKGRRFMIKESDNGVCLATMEGKCVMDVADPKARTIFENSKRVMDESYETETLQETGTPVDDVSRKYVYQVLISILKRNQSFKMAMARFDSYYKCYKGTKPPVLGSEKRVVDDKDALLRQGQELFQKTISKAVVNTLLSKIGKKLPEVAKYMSEANMISTMLWIGGFLTNMTFDEFEAGNYPLR